MKGTFLGILIAVLLVFGVAAPGHAALTYNDLVRVVYDASTGVEEATDLGPVSTLLSTSGTQTLGGGTLADQLSDFNGASGWSQLNVAYFAVSGLNNPTASTSQVLVSSTGTSVTSAWNTWNGIFTVAGSVFNYWNPTGAASQAIVATGGIATYSYYGQMDGAGSRTGTFYNWVLSQNGTGEITPVSGSSVGQNLFEWTGSNVTGTLGRNSYSGLNVSQAGTLAGTLETVVDSTGLYTTFVSDQAPVPVPSSVLLLAPGLLGLVGLRKKIWS